VFGDHSAAWSASLDLVKAIARRVLFEEIGRAAKRAVISEGLIARVTAAEVSNPGSDLAARPHCSAGRKTSVHRDC
jgi:hypothetical protein